MTSALTPVDPPELPTSPAFAQGMIVPAGPTLYVGGQNGTDSDGTLLEGLEAQTEQAMRNLLAVLDAAGTVNRSGSDGDSRYLIPTSWSWSVLPA